MSAKEMQLKGWKSCDFILVSGDAYVDHPSFGTAIIGRWLERLGFRVGVIAQPDVKKIEDFRKLGRPNLAFLINAGNLDSMVANYTVNRKLRREDAYTPGGVMGKRPDRAVIAYSAAAKGAYKGVAVILGGLEASLRRVTHYDFWQDKLRRSVLIDSKADMLLYGMGELATTELAKGLAEGIPVRELKKIRGTVVRCFKEDLPDKTIILPSFEEQVADKKNFAKAFKAGYENTDPISARALAEKIESASHKEEFLLQNPPQRPLSRAELDSIYDLPFTRKWHPSYDASGGISALKEVEFSLTSVRGCFGGCSFCAITYHQGRQIVSRSHESIVKEAKHFTESPNFRGTIHDIGGPTANFRKGSCEAQAKRGTCSDKSCLGFSGCPACKPDHSDYLALLRKVRALPGVKHLFIRSGIRYDYLLKDSNDAFFRELVKYHVSGQLKVAPEHVVDRVLRVMNKPPVALYDAFKEKFFKITKEVGKNQFVIPYLMSSHPGSDLKAAIEMAFYLKKTGFVPDQVQDYYPTPGTLSTAIYYLGFDPLTGERVYVAKNEGEKHKQRALLHFHKPENAHLVRKALLEAGRSDLIGNSRECLVKPSRMEDKFSRGQSGEGVKGGDSRSSRSENRSPRRPDRARNGKKGQGRPQKK